MTAWERSVIDRLLLGLAGVAVVANLVLSPGAPRAAITVLAALSVPGGALSTRMSLTSARQAASVIVGLSLAVETILALGMLWTGGWYPVPGAVALMTLSCAALALDLARGRQPEAAPLA